MFVCECMRQDACITDAMFVCECMQCGVMCQESRVRFGGDTA